MIFLGLEKPVPYSGMSIFDPTMANMVLNALNNYIQAMKEDYLRGREDLKEFNKNFGDFFSPILKDMEWYDLNVTGATRDFINGLYERGIDPLRSPEARAMISRWVNSMPTGRINQLKESAMAANEYLKNKGALEAAGKYSDDFERFANGGILLNDWDTVKNGMWTRTSPAELKSLKELTEPWFNNRTAHDLDKAGVESFGMTYDPRYDYTGFTYGDLLGIAAGQTPGWNGGVYADYYRQLAKNKLGPNATPEQIEALLLQDIATANKEWMINPSKSVNELYLQDLKNRQAQIIAGMRGGRRGNGSGDDQEDLYDNTTFMDRLQHHVDENAEEKSFGRNTIGDTLTSFADYWDKLAKSYESRGKVIGTKNVTRTEQINTPLSYPSPMGGGLRIGPTEREVTEKQNIYNQKDNKIYNKAIYERDRWLNYMKTGEFTISKYDTSKDAKEARKILAKINKLKTLDKDLISRLSSKDKPSQKEVQFLQAYMLNEILSMHHKTKSNSPLYLNLFGTRGVTTTEDLKKRSSAFWDTYRAEGLQPVQNKILSAVFNGTLNTKKDPSLPNENVEIVMGSGYKYAPVRQANISGGGRFKYNDIHSKFDRWLQDKHVVSFEDNDVVTAMPPVGPRAGRQLDVLKYPVITKEQFDDFYNRSGASKYGSKEKVAQKLGLVPKNEKLTYVGSDKQSHTVDTYYHVPIIRTVDPTSYRDINVLSDIMEYSASVADQNANNSEAQALLAELLISDALNMIK